LKLLFFVTEDYYFVSHRLGLALAAQAHGYDVSVVTRVRRHGDVIRGAGLRLVPFEIARSSLNPLTEAITLLRLVRLYRRERPDLVHHVAMKPVLYGSIAARLAGRPAVINAVAGMGWLFTSKTGWARSLERSVRAILARALGTGIALVQNPDDVRLLVELGVPRSQIRRIPGSGIDVDAFPHSPQPDTPPVVVLPARLLWDKGVGEFVSAAQLLRQRGSNARFLLAGEPDPLNPASVPAEQVAEWVRKGIVEHAGWVVDMPSLLAGCHVVCLPSYREGLPRALVEAAAAGRPIVTTDVPGCREVVRHGENGLLVPPRDTQGLADALQRLIEDPELRTRMGACGRVRAEQEFSLDTVVQQTMAVYREALA
jgi:glycosyltransferase involved in cell wall biosynthesis